MELERAQRVAEGLVNRLKPRCRKIAIAGSIRRKKGLVKDIDLVLIPNDLWNFHAELMKLGQLKMSGTKVMRLMVGSVQVDLYFASEETWATLLLIRTGSAENNIRLATLAKKKGWRLAASGDGLFDENGQRIAGDSEESIFRALGLAYKEPWERS